MTLMPLSLLGASPAMANDRDDYEQSLGTPPLTLQPPGELGRQWEGVGTGVSATTVISHGELLIEDRPFDDTGADTVPGNGASMQSGLEAATLPGLCTSGLNYSTGDLSYPADDEHRANSADLVQVRVAADDASVHVLFQLQTLVSRTTTRAALLMDTDRDAETGTAAGFIGFDTTLTVDDAGASLAGRPVRGAVNLDGNTMEAAFPTSALPPGPWRVNAISYDVATGALADAAYVGDEPVAQAEACKLDAVQAVRLAEGRLDSVPVDPHLLAAGTSDVPPLHRGALTRNYVPRLQLGEGHARQQRYGQGSGAARIYRGTVQPYSIYVPSTYDPARQNPVILLLHCLNCWHTVFNIAAFPGVARLAESRGALLVTPFSYGEAGHYEGEAQTDAFEVLSDVSRRYAVDQDRLYLSGMSMGTLGTFRLGGLFPDLWARLLPVASYTTPNCAAPSPSRPPPNCDLPFNYLDLFPNYRNLPTGLVHGALDELTPVTGGREFADVLSSYGYQHRYWEWPNRTHDPRLHGLTTDVTDPFLGDGKRETSPGTVTYVIDRAMRSEGQLYDRAYWLSGLQLADGVRFGRVDATSGMLPPYSARAVSGSGQDEAGPWTMRGLDRVDQAPARSNTLTVVLRGIDAVTVDLGRAGLSPELPLQLSTDTDRATALRLGAREVAVPEGRAIVTLDPRPLLAEGASGSAAGSASPSSAQPPLPVTGWGPGVWAVVLLAAGLGVRRLRRT